MNKTVKMIVSLILAVMFLAFLGCRNETTTPNHEQPTQDANASQKPIETEQPTQTIETKPRQPYMAKMGPGRADPAKFTEKDRDYYLSRINQHDFNAVRTFLEIKDGYGIRNGEKMNEWYSPDDPTTWFYSPVNNEPYMSNENYRGYVDLVKWKDGNLVRMHIEPFIQKRSSLYGSEVPSFTGFVGEIDLSDCTSLESFYLEGNNIEGELNFSTCPNLCGFYLKGSNIEAVNLEGCKEIRGELMIEDAQQLEVLNLKDTNPYWLRLINVPKLNFELPSVLESILLDFGERGIKGINWISPNWKGTTGVDYCHVMLSTEGDGLIYVNSFDDFDSPVHFCAAPEEGHRFLGWFDLEGELVWDKENIRVNDSLKDEDDNEVLIIQLVAKFE